jgi:hypothetical protein
VPSTAGARGGRSAGKPINETVGVGNGDRERRVALSPQRRRNWLAEMHAHACLVIGPKGQAVVDPGASRTGRGPPSVVAGDVRSVDVGQRGFQTEEPECRSECRGVSDGDSIPAGTQPEWKPESHQPLVHGISKELSDGRELLAGEQAASLAPVRRQDSRTYALARSQRFIPRPIPGPRLARRVQDGPGLRELRTGHEADAGVGYCLATAVHNAE